MHSIIIIHCHHIHLIKKLCYVHGGGLEEMYKVVDMILTAEIYK